MNNDIHIFFKDDIVYYTLVHGCIYCKVYWYPEWLSTKILRVKTFLRYSKVFGSINEFLKKKTV